MAENKIIYSLQFSFRLNFSTAHSLIYLTKNIREAPNKEYIGCGIFFDLQKAFGITDHVICLTKRNHYGICGVSNDWFKSYLSNRM